jgi:alkylation response protein AidB-like acyl-CoA dehydrogenase
VKHCPLERLQALALEPGGFARDLWDAMAAMGWQGLLIPPALGGGGAAAPDLVTLLEEMGRACLPGPFVGSAVVATSMLLAAPGSSRARRLLPAVALAEESGRSELDAIEMRLDGPGRLDGTKLFVKDAHVATDLLVIGRGGEGATAAVLPMDRPGITVERLDAMGDEKLFVVRLAGVEIGAENLLGGRLVIDPPLALGALARSAEIVGATARILDLAVEHAKGRVQSGRPIGAFQAIQHHCADLLRDVEASRWLLYEAAWKVAEGDDAEAAMATAKTFSAAVGLRVARRAHQIMGAIGYCEEHPLHLLHKRILAASLDGGDASAHLEAVARSIGLA